MKRFLVFALLISAGFAFVFRAHLFASVDRTGIYLGYVEGETALISTPVAGRLVVRHVDRGQPVKQGMALFRIDTTAADAEIGRIDAELREAKAQLANLKTGKRNEELEVIRAQRREAEAQLNLANKDLNRTTPLVQTGTVAQARYDQSKSQVEQLEAKVEQLKALEAANELGGRTQELEAAQARVAMVAAQALKAASQRRDLEPSAPADAYVEDTFFEPGEWVLAGQPVVSLLSPEKIKVRFFVPETVVAHLALNQLVDLRCDGCPGDLKASVNYIAPRAEYTPPVIYSEAAREKLVFLVEAKPVSFPPVLRPGLPVEVSLGKPTEIAHGSGERR